MQLDLLPSLAGLRLHSNDVVGMPHADSAPHDEPEPFGAITPSIEMPTCASDIDRLFGEIKLKGTVSFRQYIMAHGLEHLIVGDARRKRNLTAVFQTDSTEEFSTPISSKDWRHLAQQYCEHAINGEAEAGVRTTRGRGNQPKDKMREQCARVWLLEPRVLWRTCSSPLQEELMDLVHDKKRIIKMPRSLDQLDWVAYTQALRANCSVEVLEGVSGQNVSGYALLELADAMSTYRGPWSYWHTALDGAMPYEDAKAGDDAVAFATDWQNINRWPAFPRKGNADKYGGVWYCEFKDYGFNALGETAPTREPVTMVEIELAAHWEHILSTKQGLPVPTEAAGRALLNQLRLHSNLCVSAVNEGSDKECPHGFATIQKNIGPVSTERLQAWCAHCDAEKLDARLGMMEILRLNQAEDDRWAFGSPDSEQHVHDPYLPVDTLVMAARKTINLEIAIQTLKNAASSVPPWSTPNNETMHVQLRACFDELVDIYSRPEHNYKRSRQSSDGSESESGSEGGESESETNSATSDTI